MSSNIDQDKPLWADPSQVGNLDIPIGDNMLGNLGIEFTELTNTTLSARMPVDHRTLQPYGILHGGATATLAETLGSYASQLVVGLDPKNTVVGIELNISHLRQATSGYVVGTASPVKVGRRLHTWEINIRDEGGRQISRARLSVLVLG